LRSLRVVLIIVVLGMRFLEEGDDGGGRTEGGWPDVGCPRFEEEDLSSCAGSSSPEEG
jgi:hypothetical protein